MTRKSLAAERPALRDYEGFTCLGKIVAAHGIRGEVKVDPWTDTPDYYLEIEAFWLEDPAGLKRLEIQDLRLHKNQWITLWKGITDRNQAELLRGVRVFLPDSQLRPLAENEYFLHDVLGCRVVDLQGQDLGEVVDVFGTGASDIYVVRGPRGEFLVPARGDILQSLDISQKLMRIEAIPGLFEDEDGE